MMNHCPGCGSRKVQYDGIKKLTCPDCGLVFFQNVAAAVMAALTLDGRVLFARRARDPQEGMLELPGGFIDPGESAEEGVAREIREELGLTGLDFTYVGSAPNTYPFAGITYQTCDLIYTAPITALPEIHAPEELIELVPLRLEDVNPEEIAFDSVRRAVETLRGA